MSLFGDLDSLYVPYLIVGGVLGALALWVLGLDFQSRLHRALALLAFLQGAYLFFLAFTGTRDFRIYFLLGLPPAGANFAILFYQHYRPAATRIAPGRVRAARWSLLAVAVVLGLLYLYDHDLYFDQGPPGPLYVLEPLYPFSFALLALLFLRAHRQSAGVTRDAYRVGALAFALPPAYYASFYVVDRVRQWPIATLDPIFLARFTLFFAAAFTVLAVGVLLWRAHRDASSADEARSLRRAAILVFVAVLSAVVVHVTTFAIADLIRPLVRPFLILLVVVAFWNLALPAGLAYSILRHQLFGLDVKLRFTIKSGTIAACFVAVFFIANQAAETFFTDWLGPVSGILASGLLVFAFHPLQRLGDRVARVTLPNVKAPQDLSPGERRALFRDQAEVAWMDGVLQRKERLLLDRLRDRLGLTPSEAAELESQVVRVTLGAPAAPPRRKPRTAHRSRA